MVLFCFFALLFATAAWGWDFVYRLLSATWWRTQSSIHRGGEDCRNGLSPRFSEPSRAKHIVTPIRSSAAAWPTRFLEHHSSSSHSSPSFTTLLGLPLRALMVLSDGVSSSAEVSSALAAVIIFIIELSIYMVSLSVFCVNHALQSLIINALSHIHTHKINKPT